MSQNGPKTTDAVTKKIHTPQQNPFLSAD